MRIYHKITANYSTRTILATLLLASLMGGYTAGLQIAHYISGLHFQSSPSDGDDTPRGVYIRTTYFELSEAPQIEERVVTVACIGPDGKRVQLSAKTCNEFKDAWSKTSD